MNYANQARQLREKIYGLRHPSTAQAIWMVALISKYIFLFVT
jgi:hypothetical protein